MRLVFEEYDSLSKYLETISKREPNNVFKHETLSSQKSDREFSLTGSYEEALTLAKVGYKEGLDKIEAANKKSRHTEAAPKAMPAVGPVGYAPHVPNAITGVPFSMITKTQIEQKAKVISILYYMGGHCGIDTSEFVKAGKNILNVIHTLEVQGYRVALYVMTAYCKSGEYAINRVQIKHWRQPSNPLKVSYPLIHPSYFRRNGFRWLETVPELKADFTYGYGRPLEGAVGNENNANDRRKWLKEQGILQDGWFYTERIEARDNEAEKLIEKMGIVNGGGGRLKH